MCKKLLFLTGFLWLYLLPAGIVAQSQLKRLVFCQLGQGPWRYVYHARSDSGEYLFGT